MTAFSLNKGFSEEPRNRAKLNQNVPPLARGGLQGVEGGVSLSVQSPRILHDNPLTARPPPSAFFSPFVKGDFRLQFKPFGAW